MPNEQLEKLKQQKYVAEKKLTAAKHREKQLQHELKQLTRSERTHRLCTRAGMLETFLREPTLRPFSEPPAAFPVSPFLPGQAFPRRKLPPVPRLSFLS